MTDLLELGDLICDVDECEKQVYIHPTNCWTSIYCIYHLRRNRKWGSPTSTVDCESCGVNFVWIQMGFKWSETHRSVRRYCPECIDLLIRYKEWLPRNERGGREVLIRHGMKPHQWLKMLISQNFCCALCEEPFEANWKAFSVVVDHNHKCCPKRSCGNCIRGILHQKCNMLVGFLETNSKILDMAHEYINKGNLL